MFHTQRGKWGMASFTSTRTIGKIPGQKAYQAQPATPYAYENAEEAGSVSAIAATATTPKPRKFFKSRASAGAQEPQLVTQPQPQDAGGEHEDYQSAVVAQEAAPPPPAPKPKSKHSKKKTTAIQEYFVPPAAQPAVEPEPAEYIPQPSVSQDRIRETIPSKRYLARTRKVQVNYNEDENSQPARPVPPPIAAPALTVPISAVSPSMEHPPIVLRISKGTSRLVSTDSEEANNASPPHQTLTSPHSSFTNYDTITQHTTSSVANGVIKEKTVSVQSPTPQPTTPLSNRGTRKRRSAAATTAAAAAAAPVTAPSTPETPPGQPRRTTRAIRRQQEEEELRTEQEQTAVEEEEVGSEPRPRTPEPGSENYDLYRTLASSPEPEEDPKPQPQKNKNKKEQATAAEQKMIPECTVPDVQKAVPAKRGRKKKGEEVAIAVAPLPSPPVVVNAPVPVVEEVKVETAKEEAIPQKPVPSRRGKKPKVAVEEVAALPVTPKKPRVDGNTAAATPSSTVSPRRSTRGASAAQQVTPTKMEEEPRAGAVPVVEMGVEEEEENGRAPQPSPPQPTAVKSYGRKRKGAAVATSATVPHSPSKSGGGGGGKKAPNGTTAKAEEFTPMEVATDSAAVDDGKEDMDDKPLVKLVISKKKGSIFKSRALASNEEVAKNRPVYKHKWDVDEEERNSPKAASGAGSSSGSTADKAKSSSAAFDGDFDDSETAKTSSGNFKPHRRALMASNNTYGSGGGGGASTGSNNNNSSSAATQSTTSGGGGGGGSGASNSHFNDKQTQQRHAAFYTVKQAHQIQEIGEFQEMDDDVEYILDTLQPKYPILTRCLSAMQLSTKCMTPEFRMHVRAHGTVTQFFRVLQDAPKDRSLALCTASILFVLSQDNIGMDLDRESLELMLNLLECDEVQAGGAGHHNHNPDDLGLTEQQAARNKMKVRELCEEVKAQGKAPHLNLDNVTTGALAMETLLSLTSKRAGEWFKEELRTLGGLEHIVKTICECCRQISDYVAVWTEGLLEKLRKIERCLRVLDNVMEMNEQNQSYILHYDNGSAINILVKLYQLCDTELALYPTTAGSPKDSPGVAIREALVPTLKVLISLTHSFSGRAMGAQVVGEKGGVFETSLHLLFHSSNYVPENCVFELSILALLLMTNMTMHTPVNRAQIMEANALSDFGSQFAKMPAIKALVEFFYKCEESARLAEENADAILDAKPKKEKSRKGEEIEETVTKILQKAGNHMEHTIMASYVCILIGHLVMHDDEHRRKMSAFLRPDAGFAFMAKILEKYYNFMNLTASAEALTVAHIEATKKIIDYLTQCDGK